MCRYDRCCHTETSDREGGRQTRRRNRQATDALVPAGRAGHRRLPNDRRRRQDHGLPVRRKRQLRPAGHPRGPAEPRSDSFRSRCGQPRSEAAGLSRTRASRVPDATRRALPHRRTGHLFNCEASHPRGPDHLLIVFAAPAGTPLPHRLRGAGDQDRPGSSPRRHPRNPVPESILWGEAQGYAAQAPLKGWDGIS